MMKLDEKHKKIQFSVKSMYKTIQKSEKALKKLRAQCKHPKTVLCNYMWAPGHISPNTKICSVCGEVIPQEIEFASQMQTNSNDVALYGDGPGGAF